MKNLGLRFTYIESDVLLAVLFVAAAVLTALLYRRSFRGRLSWVPCVLAALRLGAVLLALVFLLRPIVSFDLLRRREGRVVLLVDRSKSMGLPDSVGGETRLASALRIAHSEAIEKLDDLYKVERYAFSGPGTLAPLPTPSLPGPVTQRSKEEIVADGPTTDLASALRSIPQDAGPIEAIVLISDGRHLGQRGKESLPAAPVHAVGVGSGAAELPDVGWARVDSERKALRGNRVEVRGTISRKGPEPREAWISVRLDGKEVERAPIASKSGPVSLPIVPDRAGELIYELVIETAGADAVPENNVAHVRLDVSESGLQVLFFEGRARWQYKFARRALERDPSIGVTGVIHLGAGRILQQGDVPSGVSLSTREGLRRFDVLILGNVIVGDLAPGDLERVVSWVGEDGGGLIFSGGPESWLDLARTPLAEIFTAATGSAERLEGDLRVSPSLAAIDHPITRGLEDFFAPGRQGGPFILPEGFAVGNALPGAEVLLRMGAAEKGESASAPETRHPLLAVRQYGRGRVACFFTESDWRWVMERSGDGGDQLHSGLWGRMARWAARRSAPSEKGPSIQLSRRSVRLGEEVAVEVSEAVDPARVIVRATAPDRKSEAIPGGAEGDRWKGRFSPAVPGVHVLQVSGAGTQASLIVEQDAREAEETSPDWDLLRSIAAGSGGRFLTLAEASTLADGVLRDTPGAVKHVELGVDQSWPLYLALVALLVLEWVLRRRIHVI